MSEIDGGNEIGQSAPCARAIPSAALLAAALFMATADVGGEDQPPEARPVSEWWFKIVEGASEKLLIGWLRESCEEAEEGGRRVYRTELEEGSTRNRKQNYAPSAATRYKEFVETAEGRPVRFRLKEGQGKKGEGLLYEARGEVRDGSMQVTMSWGTKDDERASFPVPDDLLFPRAIHGQVRQLDKAAGTKLTHQEITYEGGRLATRTMEVVGAETVEFDGRPVGVLRVRERLEPTWDSREVLYDSDGVPLRIEYEQYAFVRCSREEALALPEREEK